MGDRFCLSRASRSLWGKSDFGEQRAWLPLFVHMVDSSLVSRHLWDEWLPDCTKNMLTRTIGQDGEIVRSLFIFLCAAHDVGKATPAFQVQPCSRSIDGDGASLAWIPERAGLPFRMGSREKGSPKHALAGQAILERVLRKEQGLSPRKARCVSSIIGCHHGKSPSRHDALSAREEFPTSMGFDDDSWTSVQSELLHFCLGLANTTVEGLVSLIEGGIAPQAASVLSGLLIMCDWIASNTGAFPLVSLSSTSFGNSNEGEYEGAEILAYDAGGLAYEALLERGRRGWARTGLLSSWREAVSALRPSESLYARRFDFPAGAVPRPVQCEALSVAEGMAEPGLMIIEAPMGEGKTEAALAAAEALAAKTGAGGVCVALPTMATTDAMFSRVHKWLERLLPASGTEPGTVYLAHGKSRLNEEYQGIIAESRYRGGDMDHDDGLSVEVSDWMFGSKRGMLSSFVVCTVDQVLMGALQMKHLALRHLALANKVVIIDECHAYDIYMRQYLDVILGWLGSWHVPVILLSATLPKSQREEIARSYMGGWVLPGSAEASECPDEGDAYPLITYTRGDRVMSGEVKAAGGTTIVRVALMPDDEQALVDLLKDKLRQGGCAGVVCDTVTRAQAAAAALVQEFGREKVTLAHARFTDIDRMENERGLREMLGADATLENGRRPPLHIVVGTQVLEQSLDIDFDILVSDIAPIDLLFQRLGRCHRHARTSRPGGVSEPCCYVRGVCEWRNGAPLFSRGVTSVYEKANLMESMGVCGLLGAAAAATLSLPSDISRLVQLAYGEEAVKVIPGEWADDYHAARERREANRDEKCRRARHCLLKPIQDMVRNRDSLTDWYTLSDTRVPGEEYGPRAVRDTQETVEVLLLRLVGREIRLPPWIGDPGKGVQCGATIPVDGVPESRLAKVAVQSAVRLPPALCRPDKIEELIGVLEEVGGPYVGAWQESPWLQGRLVLPMSEEGGAMRAKIALGGALWTLLYSRDAGLSATCDEEGNDG